MLEDGKRFPQDGELGVILVATFVVVRVSSESDAQDTFKLPLVGGRSKLNLDVRVGHLLVFVVSKWY